MQGSTLRYCLCAMWGRDWYKEWLQSRYRSGSANQPADFPGRACRSRTCDQRIKSRRREEARFVKSATCNACHLHFQRYTASQSPRARGRWYKIGYSDAATRSADEARAAAAAQPATINVVETGPPPAPAPAAAPAVSSSQAAAVALLKEPSSPKRRGLSLRIESARVVRRSRLGGSI